MTCMLVLSGRVELMVMHGGVKNNYEHNALSAPVQMCLSGNWKYLMAEILIEGILCKFQ